MSWFVFGFILGAVILQQQASLSDQLWPIAITSALVLVLVLVLFILPWRRFQSPLRHAPSHRSGLSVKILRGSIILVCALGLGFSYSSWRAQQQSTSLWHDTPAEHLARDVIVEGQIQGLVSVQEPKITHPKNDSTDANKVTKNPSSRFNHERVQRFEFVPSGIVTADSSAENTATASLAHFPTRLRLAAYGAQQPLFQTGDRWRFLLRLTPAYGNQNPYGFDYELWLYQRGIAATGYIRQIEKQLPDTHSADLRTTLSIALDRFRSQLRERIETALPHAEYPLVNIITALVIGTQNDIEQADWTLFQQTGIGHLISISGLHITMIAALMAWFSSVLWRRIHGHIYWRGSSRYFASSLWIPAQTVAIWMGLFSAFAYCLIAGFGIPAQRTLYMLATVAMGTLASRHANWLDCLYMAAIVVVMFDPWAVNAQGFWLSFCAVAVLLLAAQTHAPIHAPIHDDHNILWRKLWTKIKTAAHWQWTVTIGLIVPSIFLFGQFSLVSPLANAVAIPLMSFVITPLSLLALTLPSAAMTGLLQIAYTFLDWLHSALAYLVAILPLVQWKMPQLPWPWILWGVFWTGFIIVVPRQIAYRRLGWLVLIPLLFYRTPRPQSSHFEFQAFDVGQGTAVLISTAQHRLLFDTGPQYGPTSDAAQRVLIPYFNGAGINQLDTVILSHNDNDHTGGLRSLMQTVSFKQIMSSLPEQLPLITHATAQGARFTPCVAGDKWNWDGVSFEVLYPAAEVYAQYPHESLKDNEWSCVLRVSNGQKSILLMGDNEQASERYLLADLAIKENNLDKLKSDVLLAPHHGSKTSSMAELIAAASPKEVLIQSGFINSYGHPHPSVLTRYQESGAKIWRTDQHGALSFDSACSAAPCLKSWRDQAHRYWQRAIPTESSQP